MKVGDLVKPNEDHFLVKQDCRSYGLVLELRERSKGFAEHLIVAWNDGDVEIELPVWLEIINESR